VKRIFATYVTNNGSGGALRLVNRYDAAGREVEASMTEDSVLGWRITTDDPRVAARFEFSYTKLLKSEHDFIEWHHEQPLGVEHAEAYYVGARREQR